VYKAVPCAKLGETEMKNRIVLTVIFLNLIFSLNAQSFTQLNKIVESIRKTTKSEIITKCFDMDNDGDNDYLFSYRLGESMYFKVFINKNGNYELVNSEFGNISYDYENAVDFKPSTFVLNSKLSQCCGESPFNSFRKFRYNNHDIDTLVNYVLYDYRTYCHDERVWDYLFDSDEILSAPYSVKITIDNYNVRFSADMDKHNADFVCVENTNIIGQLKKNAIVTVIAEEKRQADKNLRTWLYVEIDKSDLNFETCSSPFAYDFFKGQKLRAWISDKYTEKLK